MRRGSPEYGVLSFLSICTLGPSYLGWRGGRGVLEALMLNHPAWVQTGWAAPTLLAGCREAGPRPGVVTPHPRGLFPSAVWRPLVFVIQSQGCAPTLGSSSHFQTPKALSSLQGSPHQVLGLKSAWGWGESNWAEDLSRLESGPSGQGSGGEGGGGRLNGIRLV